MKKDKRDERNQEIIKLYQQRKRIEDIAKKFSVDSSQVYKIINQEVEAGRIKKVKPIRKNRANAKIENVVAEENPVEAQNVQLNNVTECEPIRCTANVNKQCRYGAGGGTCGFSSVTNKCRSVTNESLGFKGCSTEECIRFQKIDKEHPAYFKKRIYL